MASMGLYTGFDICMPSLPIYLSLDGYSIFETLGWGALFLSQVIDSQKGGKKSNLVQTHSHKISFQPHQCRRHPSIQSVFTTFEQ